MLSRNLYKIADDLQTEQYMIAAESALDQYGFRNIYREDKERLKYYKYESSDFFATITLYMEDFRKALDVSFRLKHDIHANILPFDEIMDDLKNLKLFKPEYFRDTLSIRAQLDKDPILQDLEHEILITLRSLSDHLEHSAEKLYHHCGEDIPPGLQSFEGFVYHGISRDWILKEKRLRHIWNVPLGYHMEYGIKSISTSCSFDIAKKFSESAFSALTIVKYKLKTDRLFVLDSADVESGLEKELRELKADAFMIPVGFLKEHEIAVMNKKVLTPVQLIVSVDGEHYQYYDIPESKIGKWALEEKFQKLRKIGERNRKQKYKEISQLNNQYSGFLKKHFGSIGIYKQNLISGEGYYITLQTILEDLPTRLKKSLMEYLNQEFPQYKFELKRFLHIYFDDIQQLVKDAKPIGAILRNLVEKAR